jgi:hypothetical protein
MSSRTRHLLTGALLGALVVAAVPTVSAWSGQPIIAGERNVSGTDQTKLWSVANNSTLKVTNKLPGTPALWLEVRDDTAPPLRVSSPAKVDNLNVDLLDGMDSTAFATTITVAENLAVGESVVLADPGGMQLELVCYDPSTVGTTVQTTVMLWAETENVEYVIRDATTLAALQVGSEEFGTELDASGNDGGVLLVGEGSTGTVPEGWPLSRTSAFSAFSPTGSSLDGMLTHHVGGAFYDRCVVTGHVIVSDLGAP